MDFHGTERSTELREANVKTRNTAPLYFTFAAACTILALGGCSSDPSSPGVEPEIVNGAESFEFQVSAVRNYSGSWNYTWSNASRTASIDQSSVLDRGDATLKIVDADGSVVYERALTDDGSFETAAGAAGDWRLTITLDRASGDLNFRADEGS